MDNDPGVNYNGEVVDLILQYPSQSIYMHVVNTSGSSQNYKFRRVYLTSLTGMTDQFCDCQLCYPTTGTTWTTSSGCSVAAGDSSVMKPIIDFSGTGTAHIRYYILDANNGNALVDSIDFNITSTLTINEKPEVSFSAYPNPASNEFTIDFTGNEGMNFNVVVYNIVGERVMSQILTNGVNKLEIEKLSNGVYFYSIMNKDSILETKKLVVKRQILKDN